LRHVLPISSWREVQLLKQLSHFILTDRGFEDDGFRSV
jgi:hypothetical protein